MKFLRKVCVSNVLAGVALLLGVGSSYAQLWELDSQYTPLPISLHGIMRGLEPTSDGDILVYGVYEYINQTYSPDKVDLTRIDAQGKVVSKINHPLLDSGTEITLLKEVEPGLFFVLIQTSNVGRKFFFFDQDGKEITNIFSNLTVPNILDVQKTPEGNFYIISSESTGNLIPNNLIYTDREGNILNTPDVTLSSLFSQSIITDTCSESIYFTHPTFTFDNEIIIAKHSPSSGEVFSIALEAKELHGQHVFSNGNFTASTDKELIFLDKSGMEISRIGVEDLIEGAGNFILEYIPWGDNASALVVRRDYHNIEILVFSSDGIISKQLPLLFETLLPTNDFHFSNDFLITGKSSFIYQIDTNNLMEPIGYERMVAILSFSGGIDSIEFLDSGDMILAGQIDMYNGEFVYNLVRTDENGNLIQGYAIEDFRFKPIWKTATTPEGTIYAIVSGTLYKILDTDEAIPIIGPVSENDREVNVLDFVFMDNGDLLVLDLPHITSVGLTGSIRIYDAEGLKKHIIVSDLSIHTPWATGIHPIARTVAYPGSKIVKLEDGSVLIAGDFRTEDASTPPKIIKINTNGSLDTSFQPKTSGLAFAQSHIELLDSGSFLVIAPLVISASDNLKIVTKYNSAGKIDSVFNPTILTLDFDPDSIETADGQILLAQDSNLYLLNPDGTINPDINWLFGQNYRHKTDPLFSGPSFYSPASGFLGKDQKGNIYLNTLEPSNDRIPSGLTRIRNTDTVSDVVIHPTHVSLEAGETILQIADPGIGNQDTSYQWYRNGVALEGQTSRSLSIPFARSTDSGFYSLTATKDGKTYTTDSGQVSIANPVSKIRNFSARGLINGPNTPLICGFVINNQPGTRILMRASGPSLSELPADLRLNDPAINLYYNFELADTIAGEHSTPELLEIEANLGAFRFQEDTQESALIANLPSGVHAFQVFSPDRNTGFSLLEAYDISDELDSIAFRNNSVRGVIDESSKNLILGFVIEGADPASEKEVLIRGIGPGLLQYGVANPIANPQLWLVQIGSPEFLSPNLSWEEPHGQAVAMAAERVGAFPLEEGSLDTAIVATLHPGVYGAILIDLEGGEGEALIELYDLE